MLRETFSRGVRFLTFVTGAGVMPGAERLGEMERYNKEPVRAARSSTKRVNIK